jgi:hypothetical protein
VHPNTDGDDPAEGRWEVLGRKEAELMVEGSQGRRKGEVRGREGGGGERRGRWGTDLK